MRFALVAAVLLALPLAGADFPLAPPDRVAASGSKSSVDVASNGSEFMAAWIDDRGGPGLSDVYAARFTSDRTLLDEVGIRISNGYALRANVVAAGAGAYLVGYHTWSSDGVIRAYVTRVEDGRSGPPAGMGDGSISEMVTNGRSICMLLRQWPRASAVFTDGFGEVLSVVPLPPGTRQLIVAGDRYWALTTGDGTTLIEITPEGLGRSRVVGMTSTAALSASADRIVVASSGIIGIDTIFTEYVILDHDANVLATGRIEDRRPFEHISYGSPEVVPDGREFLLAWSIGGPGGARFSRAVRLQPDGRYSETALPDYMLNAHAFAVAGNGTTRVVVTREDADVYNTSLFARTLTSFDAPASEPLLLSRSSTYQNRPHAAAIGPVTFTVYAEGRGRGALAGTLATPDRAARPTGHLAGPENTVHKFPTVAASVDQFLAVWVEIIGSAVGRLVARRVGPDGSFRDAAMLTIAVGGETLSAQRPAAASNGGDFFVAWSAHSRGKSRVRGAILRADGSVASRVLLNESEAFKNSVRAVWTGSLYAVLWAESVPLAGGKSKRSKSTVRMVRVTADGVVLDSQPVVVTETVGDPLASLEVASDGRRQAMAVWVASRCIRGVTLNAAAIAGSEQTIACDSRETNVSARRAPLELAAAWNGAGYTLFWITGPYTDRVLQYATVDEHLHALAPRVLVRGGTFGGLTAASASNSIFLAYDKAAYGDEYGGVRRVFGRFLPRTRFAQ